MSCVCIQYCFRQSANKAIVCYHDDFADDVALLSHKRQDLRKNKKTHQKLGVEILTQKNKVMGINEINRVSSITKNYKPRTLSAN